MDGLVDGFAEGADNDGFGVDPSNELMVAMMDTVMAAMKN